LAVIEAQIGDGGHGGSNSFSGYRKGDGQTEAASLFLGSKIWVENSSLKLCRNPHALVHESDPDIFTRRQTQGIPGRIKEGHAARFQHHRVLTSMTMPARTVLRATHNPHRWL
jgi:hypothetical protein